MPNLHVKIKGEQENYEAEPVSPTGLYFNSRALFICNIVVLETEIPFDETCAMTQLRDVFLPINPRFSSIMMYDTKGIRRWKRVEVNLEDHIYVPSFLAGLSIQSYDDIFDEYLTKLCMDSLPEDRPLWEVHIIKYPTSKAVGHVIFKLHHALGDGYSLMGALLSCLKRADKPDLPLTFPSTRRTSQVNRDSSMGIMRSVPRMLYAIYRGACDFGWSFLKSTYIADDKTPIRSANPGLGFLPFGISTLALSLDKIKLIKGKLGTTVNDTISGIIFLGTRLYMETTDAEFSSSRSTAVVILNTRNIRDYKSVEEMLNADTKTWGNKFAILHISIPDLSNDKRSKPLDFVYEAQEQIMRQRTSPALYLNAQYLDISNKFRGPEVIAEHIHSTLNKSSMTMTNIIGPTEKVSLNGHPIKGMYFMSSGCPQSLVIAIMSYMQTLRIVVGYEKGFIDSQRFNACIENAFEQIYEAATKSE